MNKREWIMRSMMGEHVDTVPMGFWFHFLDNSVISSGMEHPELVEKSLEGHRKFQKECQPDFVKMMTDGLFYRPSSTYPVLDNAHDLARIQPLGKNHPYINRCVELAKKVRKIFGEDTMIFYNIPSPFHHILKELYGTSAMKEMPPCICEDRKAFKSALEALLEDMLNLTERVLTDGHMDGIYLGVHNDNVFSRDDYEELIMPGELKILEKANSIHPVNIIHICGYRGRVNNMEFYRDYPAAVFNWSLHTTNLNLAEGKKYFRHCKCVIGGFDQTPGSLIHTGNKKEIQDFVYHLLQENGTQGFIVGADCTIPSDTPAEHLLWVREACQRYPARP